MLYECVCARLDVTNNAKAPLVVRVTREVLYKCKSIYNCVDVRVYFIGNIHIEEVAQDCHRGLSADD